MIPLNLVEGIRLGDARDELGLAGPYDFSALTPSDDVTGASYMMQYPHP